MNFPNIDTIISLINSVEYINEQNSKSLFIDALIFMHENRHDSVFYTEKRNFHINNIAILEDCGEAYYLYESVIDINTADVITAIESDIPITVYISGNIYNHIINEPVTDLSEMTLIPLLIKDDSCIKIRFLIKKDNPPENFFVKYKCHLLSPGKKRSLTEPTAVATNSHLYRRGICTEIGTFL